MTKLVAMLSLAPALAGALLCPAPAAAQIAAAVVAPGTDGALHVDGQGNGVFAVVAANLGPAPGPVLQDAPCGSFEIQATGALATGVCVLDQATGACAGPALPAIRVYLAQGGVGVYGVLVGGATAPRIQVTFRLLADDSSSFPFHCAFPNHPPVDLGERGAVSIEVARP